ncbi:protein-S-isoprenylcysteine O-methyltransferase-like [Exaiptasia diaphana]|uniref:Protein-S-isoprenylcysteine O-methyltransferase n=1 Tax=Exaiptasia diaphana TaxID=2652724 RepID=A0A913X4Q4_EXADI|nr:protein-S-isoprenylcysteine O-methyltransferase-like [Exaiptasia diaphana]
MAVVKECKIALAAFFAYFCLSLALFNRSTFTSLSSIFSSIALAFLAWCISNFSPHADVAKRAAFLGCAFGCSLVLSFSQVSYRCFGWYMTSLSFFHFSEYIIMAIYNPKTLSIDSFLLNHSLEYKMAAVASWIEFGIEYYFFPNLKSYVFISYVGALLLIGGEITRKVAMITAQSNFTHLVQFHKKEGHVLVTTGIYSLFRHPSYVGWFYWSIGTQLTLCNPVCLFGYAVASWRFFKERIEYEEITLLNFFQYEYIDYQKKVGTGLPFIKGYLVSDEEIEKMK